MPTPVSIAAVATPPADPRTAVKVAMRPVAASKETNESAPAKKSADSAKPAQASAEQMKQLQDALQQRFATVAPELQFSVDQSSGRAVIKVIDQSTKEVIRQIPSEQALKLNEALANFQQGLLLDRKV